MPHSVQQPLHVDAKSLWPNVQHPHPPYALILNAALTDITGIITPPFGLQHSTNAHNHRREEWQHASLARHPLGSWYMNMTVPFDARLDTTAIPDFQTDDEYRILEEDKATQGRTPVRANMKAGSLLIRDNRLWHRYYIPSYVR